MSGGRIDKAYGRRATATSANEGPIISEMDAKSHSAYFQGLGQKFNSNTRSATACSEIPLAFSELPLQQVSFRLFMVIGYALLYGLNALFLAGLGCRIKMLMRASLSAGLQTYSLGRTRGASAGQMTASGFSTQFVVLGLSSTWKCTDEPGDSYEVDASVLDNAKSSQFKLNVISKGMALAK